MRPTSTRIRQRGDARAKSLGIFLVLAALGGWLFFELQSEEPPQVAEPGTEEPVELPVAKGPDWQLPEGQVAKQGPDGAPLAEPDPVTEPTLTFGGTAVAEGQTEPTRIVYRKGQRNRYKLTNTVRGEDKASGNARGRRETRWMNTEVVAVNDSGGARVRVTFDALRMQMLLSAEFGFTYDSRDPDPALLADPRIAALVKPAEALLNIPVEFELNADGTPERVFGVDRLREAFLAALPPNADRAFAPSDEQQLRDVGGLIFPPVGREMVTGTGRKYVRLEDTSVRYDIHHEGQIDVIATDGDRYVAKATATPTIQRRSGPPRSENEAQVVEGHIVSDADASTAKWQIDRATGRLELAELRAAYELWISFKGGPGDPAAGVAKDFTPIFTIIDQLTTLEYLGPPEADAGKKPEKDEEETDQPKGPDQGAAPGADGTGRQASTSDQGESTRQK